MSGEIKEEGVVAVSYVRDFLFRRSQFVVVVDDGGNDKMLRRRKEEKWGEEERGF